MYDPKSHLRLRWCRIESHRGCPPLQYDRRIFLRRALIVAALAAAVRLSGDRSALGETPPPNAVASAPADDAARLTKLLGPDRRLRDFEPFTTERGEAAFLVLFVTDPHEAPADYDLSDAHSCPEELAGIALDGIYHVALVIDGRLVNEVAISPRLSLPLRNTRYQNYWFWRQGTALTFDAPDADVVEPTKLIHLADVNGDGHPWEFRLLQYGTCGHSDTLLAGYSPKQRRAILYPIIIGRDMTYWHDNFFPPPGEAMSNPKHYEFECGDHGADMQSDEDFEYNDAIEAWVRTGGDQHLCAGPYVTQPPPANVQLHIGAVRGLPGEVVTVPVTIDPAGAGVEGVELHLPLGWSFAVKRCTARRASEVSDVRLSSWGIDAVSMGLGCDTDEPADCTPVTKGTALFSCEVEISQYARAGTYTLSPTGFLVIGDSGWRLHTTVTDGEIVVGNAAPTTTGH